MLFLGFLHSSFRPSPVVTAFPFSTMLLWNLWGCKRHIPKLKLFQAIAGNTTTELRLLFELNCFTVSPPFDFLFINVMYDQNRVGGFSMTLMYQPRVAYSTTSL